MAELAGKKAWITGASSGIGAATAALLARNGVEVVLTARRKERLTELARQIVSEGGRAHTLSLDLTRRAEVEAVTPFLDGIGGVDILINNAGVMPLAPLAEGRVEEWENTIDVNLKGLLYAIKAVLPGLLTRRSGHIVNLGSVAGRQTFPGAAVYCGTKFAVRAISDVMCKELRE